MVTLLLILMVVSHLAAAFPAWSALRRGTLPLPPIAAAVSFLLYYDFGLAFEWLGFPYDVRFFRSLMEAYRQTQLEAIGLLIVAPWVLLCGARLTQFRLATRAVDAVGRARLVSGRRAAFYCIAVLIAAFPAWYGLSRFLNGDELWHLRSQVGSDLGPLIVLLYLPMHVLAFYVTMDDARTPNGRLFTFFLAFAAAGSSIICSQRTLLLIPAILVAISLFRRISLIKASGIVAASLVAAAAMLPMFRGTYQNKDLREDNLVVEIVHNDFSRAGVLATVIDLSRPVGTDVLPYPMSGYVYSSLFFVPRQFAPFKGRSTAMQFTAHVANKRPEWLNWGFGVGMLEELILNAGMRFSLLGVFIYGLVLGWLARTELKHPAVSMPLRLGPLFLCAYHLPSLLLSFGVMWCVCTQLSWVFAENLSAAKSLDRSRTLFPGTASTGTASASDSHAPLSRRVGAW